MKSKLVAFAAVALMSLSSAAFALNVKPGSLSAPDTNSSIENTVSGSFTDVWNFKLTNVADAAFSLTSISNTTGSNPGFTQLRAWIDGLTPVSFSYATVSPGSVVSTINLVATGLGIGSHTVTIQGITTGGLQQSYGSSLTLITPAVPEPETYAMFLAGLAAVRLVTRRKAAKS